MLSERRRRRLRWPPRVGLLYLGPRWKRPLVALGLRYRPGSFVRHLPPEPFLDDAAFPYALHRVRDEVVGRGGWVQRSGEGWQLVHPDREQPRIEVRFHGDGAASVAIGRWGEEYVDADRVYDPRVAELDSIVLAVLDGGYSEFSAVAPGGHEIDRGWQLTGAVSLSGRPVGFAAAGDAGPADVETVWTSYEAWPSRG